MITAGCDVAPCGRVQHRHYDTIRHLRCQSCASHTHVGDLPGDNAVWNTLYSSLFILLQYQVTQTNVNMSVTHGADRRATG